MISQPMDNNKNIQLELNFEEVNVILKALGNLPFNEVYDLIGKIHEQANTQSN
jgi:hypothetical protein